MNCKPKTVPADRVHGSQFELEPSPRAYIALQAHRINDNAKPGEEVRWRNIWIKELSPPTGWFFP